MIKIIYSQAKVIHKMYRYINDLLIISSLYLVMKFLAAAGVEIMFKIIYSHAKVIHKMYRYIILDNNLLIISSLYLVMIFLAAAGGF